MSPFPIPCVNRASSAALRTRYGGDTTRTDAEPVLLETPEHVGQEDVDRSVRSSDRGPDDWVGDINTLLRFNASFSGRGLLGGSDAFEEQGDETHK